MRKLLLVSILVCLVLLVEAPAQAVHLYFKMRVQGSSTYVETSCPAGRKLVVQVGSYTQNVTVPSGKGGKFITTKLNQVARSTGTISATCNGHKLTTARLAKTGAASGWELALGLGLVAVGALLVLLGRRPPAGPARRRRRRPPVRVYAQ